MKKIVLYIILVIPFYQLTAQDKSNKGTEFWLGYGNSVSFDVVEYNGINNQEQVLYISAEEATEVTVSVNGTAWSRTVSIPANSVDVSIVLPKDGPDDCRIRNEGIFDRAIHVVSTKPVVVYAHQYNTQLSGATMLLPVETYGYTYYSINYKQPPVNSWGKNWFYVIASEDNTRIQVTASDTTQGGLLPGETITVNLNKGQLYNVFGKVAEYNESDLTGSKIVSVAGADGNCHPIAVFSGCSRLILCVTDGGEIAQQQIFPASAWGARYLSFHSIIAANNPLTTPFINVFRVMVANPATVVKRNGQVLTGLQKNLFYEFESSSGDYIEADQPVMVCQYTHNSNQCTGNALSPQGDPELLFLPPIEQGIKKARVYNTKNAVITVNYLTIIIPTNGVPSLKIDGAAVPASIQMLHPNNPGYTIVAKRLLGPGAQHTIESDSAFSAMIYGSGIFESYGYIAGTLINNLNCIGSIQNVLNVTSTPNTFTCPQSPFQLTIKIAYRATSLQWLFSQVTGITPATDTTISNPEPVDSLMVNGRKYFTYHLATHLTLSDTGIYNIPIIYTSPEIDHCSHQEKTTVPVLVTKGPVADFNYTYYGCREDTAFFTGLADVNNYSISKYAWRFDDNSTDTAINTFKKFTEGDHLTYLKVIANNGCVDDTSRIITTYPSPVAKFGFSRNICRGDSALLTDSSVISSGSIAAWHWNFADGSSSIYSSNSPFYHLYHLPGNYQVALSVLSDKGCTSDTAIVPLTVNEKPRVNFSIAGTPCPDSSFYFTPVVTANGNNIQQSFWDFGDGKTQAVNHTNTINHSYAQAANNIPVRLMVSGGSGCESDTATQIIPMIYTTPEAAFDISGNAFCPEKNIVFDDAGSAGDIQSWTWDFGNGISTAAPPVNHTYNNAGTYTATLTLLSTQGCGSKPAVRQLTIYPPPNIDAGPSILKTAAQSVVINAVINDTGTYHFQWSPSLFLDNTTILKPSTNTQEDMLYTITAMGGAGNCEAFDTVSVRVLRALFIPSAFSPNHDGLNDVWNIPSINGSPLARVIIFNRFGEKIFESTGYSKPWDGTYKGVAQPVGAYFYQVQPDIKKEKIITGSVMIVR